MSSIVDSDSDSILQVSEISKKFSTNLRSSLYYGLKDVALEITGRRTSSNSLRSNEFWALKDVSFDLKKGSSIGLIGANGSGKTTLLRLISGLIKPDSGSIRVHGRVTPLIALGAAFSPVLTGRENLVSNMAMFGLTQGEIEDNFDNVVNFAEIGHALDAPVQTYSSGMVARLAFSCAIFTKPDILIVDEVLAVGDSKFQAKCSVKLSELVELNTSFILVSHNPMAVKAICETAVYLKSGSIVKIGPIDDVLDQYESDQFGNSRVLSNKLFVKKPEDSLGVDITKIYFTDENDNEITVPESGRDVTLCIECSASRDFDRCSLGIKIDDFTLNGRSTIILESHYDNVEFALSKGVSLIKVKLQKFILKPGSYLIEMYLKKEQPHANLDIVTEFPFNVEMADSDNVYIGKSAFYQSREWDVKTLD